MKQKQRSNANRKKVGMTSPLSGSPKNFWLVLSAWWDHHMTSAIDSLQRLLVTPLASLMTWTVIGIALALPAILYISLNNVQQLSHDWENGTHISLYLDASITATQGLNMAEQLAQRQDVYSADYFSQEQALEFFKEHSGLASALHNLDENPFPASVELQYQDHISPAQVKALLQELHAIDGVESIKLDMEWVQRLYSFMQLGQRVTLILMSLLSLGVLLVVGNTIRLAIQNRRDEIVVVKLVGGTDAFVRRPFLYSGIWYGLGGGLIAWLVVALTHHFLKAPIAELTQSYDSQFELLAFGINEIGGLLLIGAALGLVGSILAVSYHLTEIEP